jgi:hypothetical protein
VLACCLRRAASSRAPACARPHIRAEIKLTSGKGLADLTVPLSTIVDAVVKQTKARLQSSAALAQPGSRMRNMC